MPLGKLWTEDDLLLCTACGAQYEAVQQPDDHANNNNNNNKNDEIDNNISSGNDASSSSATDFIPAANLKSSTIKSCRICDDPRQFVPATGQSFTTLSWMKSGKQQQQFESGKLGGSKEEGNGKRYTNVFRRRQEGEDSKVIEMWTEPKFGIGQRACIITTPHGNIMWDLVAYLDQDTINEINELGGLEFIIISHPHFYTTWADWSTTFQCPVYMAQIDAQTWANRTAESVMPASSSTASSTPKPDLRLLKDTYTTLLPGLTAIIAGGHFPGSMMLHSSPPNTDIPSLFVADTIMAVPSANNPDLKYHQSGTGIVSYTFMWSIPNMIPLDPDTVLGIWKTLKDPKFEFRSSYAVFSGGVVQALQGEKGLRHRVLQSMKVFVTRAGWKDHALLRETLPEED